MLNFVEMEKAVEKKIDIKIESKQEAGKYWLHVVDTTSSVTGGFVLTYAPVMTKQGTLYDPKEGVSAVNVPNFSAWSNKIIQAYNYFLNDANATRLSNGKMRSIYEGSKFRFTMTSNQNSVNVVLTITDQDSPFFMMAMPFVVTTSNKDQKPYIIGSDKFWNKESDIYQSLQAHMSPKKKRYVEVAYSQGTQPTLSIGHKGVQPDGSILVDERRTSFRYLKDFSSKYKAMAYIQEQILLDVIMPKALALLTPANQPEEKKEMAFLS